MNAIPRPDGPYDIYTATQWLWEAAADQMDAETLRWFAAGEHDEFTLRNLADTTENLAALVLCDANESGKPISGAFQERESVGTLLATLAASMRHVAALQAMSSAANDRIRNSAYYSAIKAGRQPASPQQNGTERQPAASRPRAATATSGAA